MHTIQRSALVPYSADKMYRLVADIPSYPQFLKWCGGATIVEEGDDCVVASILINFRGLNKAFTTRNLMLPGRKIEMSLVKGPFSHLKGKWLFVPLADNASKIELEMDFDFDNVLIKKLVGPIFSYIANHQVDAFYQRARHVYGE